MLFRRVLKYFKPHKWAIILAMLCTVLVGLVSAAMAKVVKPVIDDVFINHDGEMLKILPFVVIGLFILKGLGRFGQQALMVKVGEVSIMEMRNDLMGRIQHRELSFFEANNTGSLMTRMLSDVSLMQNSVSYVVDFIRYTVTMLGLTVVMFQKDWRLALVASLSLPLAMYPMRRISALIKKYTRRTQERIGGISKVLVEAFTGIEVVKAFGTEDREKKKFREQSLKVLYHTLKRSRLNSATAPIMELLASFGIAAIIWYGGNNVINGVITPGDFFEFLTALLMMGEPVRMIGSVNNKIQQASAAAERVFEVIDETPAPCETEGDKELHPPVEEVRFEDVHFSYNTREEVIRGVSFVARRGEMVAFVGESGAGKSTILKLLPRFYSITAGAIKINGIDIREYDVKSLRSQIAIVNQSTFLFDDTVLSNIALGRPEATREEVIAAATAANALRFISELPNGFDTVIGERGDTLSGGQKQRIAIARAILRNAPILMLDEATSALDSESEKEIQSALTLLMEGRTTFVIAHRLSTIRHADRIVFLKKGLVTEVGKHQELVARDGDYARLCRIQFGEV
ncbi:ABC transporter ATP-binding protein [bacterium]|nr:MAG: ABC transporter ATP-binding protein [bacterium]